ncbi:MAG: carbohydrate-binding protein [Pontiella sp.]
MKSSGNKYTGFDRARRGITGLLLFLVISTSTLANPVLVDSLENLLPYLKQDDVQVVMKPGTYRITGAEAKAGKFGSDTFQDWCKTLLLFEGSGSTYDFTGVTLEVETSVFQSLGKYDIFEVQIVGNHTVIKNLTIEDIGSVYDAPSKGAVGIVMDGSHNRIEGVHLSTKGSYPYGYGEAFGKGGKNVVRHMKHCGILVRGYSNHVKDCTIIHRCFGHALFMQAADQPLIEGCYIEGEMRETNTILAEKGTGSIADRVNFMTYFGYPIPPNFAMCTGEEGIRAYDSGQTWIDGEIISRRTMNPTVLNCTIKNMRGGVTLTHAGGKKYVEGCVAIGCTRGFCIGSGDIVDCYADTQYGPALGVDYERDSGMTAEITLLPNKGKMVNGTQYAAFITGRNHHITLRSQVPNPDQKLMILIGGDKRNIGSLGKVNEYSASNITINNYTAHPIMMGERVENISGITGGLVTDLGKNNRIMHEPVKQLEIINEHQKELAQGETIEFEIDLPIAGTYFIDYQVAAPANVMFSVSSNEQELETVSFPASRGWTTVRSEIAIALNGGKQVLSITALSSEMKFNGMDLILNLPTTPVVPRVEVFNFMGVSLGRMERADVTVYPGHMVVLEPGPTFGGTWRWSGPNGFYSENRKLTLSALTKKRAGRYIATFTNISGYETSATFEIEVEDLITIDAAAQDGMEFEVDVPLPGMYVIGYKLSAETAGHFSASMEGVEIDRVDFEATARDWETVSSEKIIYLKKGVKKMQLTSASKDWKLEWIKLKSVDYVSPATLPLVYQPEQVLGQLSLGVIDISEEELVDIYVVYQPRRALKAMVQIDGGTWIPLKMFKAGPGMAMAYETGLSCATLKLVVDGGRDGLEQVDGIYILKSRDPYARIEAEDYDGNQGTHQEDTQDVGGGKNVGSIRNGDWLKYSNLALIGMKSVRVRVANIQSGGSCEIRIGSPDGQKIATLEIPKTGGWQTWETVTVPLENVSGIFDVYLVFSADSMAGNLNWIEFLPN